MKTVTNETGIKCIIKDGKVITNTVNMISLEKQLTYLICVQDKLKRKIADSGLALIRDYAMGWFDVPISMCDEFLQKFPGIPFLEHSACDICLTKEDILAYNQERTPKGCYGIGTIACMYCKNCE